MTPSSILEIPALVFALAMFVGVAAQVVSRHVRVPGVVLLLIAGVALGPDAADVIRPQALGPGLEAVVGVAVAVILFEGGLNLNVRVLRRNKDPISRLVLAGSCVTVLGAALAANIILGWEVRRAVLFGTLVVVTGPTVINPILRRVHVRANVEAILEAEGVFIDALGATISVVALEVLLAPPNERLGLAMFGVLRRFGIGTVTGLVGGGAFAVLLHFRRALPEGMVNIAALATSVCVFEASNAIVPESGIVAVLLAAIVVGHSHSHELEDLRNFKEQLTILLVATLFVLLSADVRLANVRHLGLAGVFTVLAVALVVRPANVFLTTPGTGLTGKEKLFISWLAPRGIVAAAVSSLFAKRMAAAGLEGGEDLRALVFLVIATTVVVFGMSAGPVARVLGVARPRDVGYAILGAGDVARLLGRALRDAGEEVVFIETNADFARVAEQEDGFKVVFGSGLDERALVKARVDTRRGCIGATGTASVNLLFARRAHEHARSVATFAALDAQTAEGGADAMIAESRSKALVADAAALARRTRKGAHLRWLVATRDGGTLDELATEDLVPLVLVRGELAAPLARPYVAHEGDRIALAVLSGAADDLPAPAGFRDEEARNEPEVEPA